MFTLKPVLLALWWAGDQRSLGRLDHHLQPSTEETWISSSPHSSVMLADGFQAPKSNYSLMPPAASHVDDDVTSLGFLTSLLTFLKQALPAGDLVMAYDDLYSEAGEGSYGRVWVEWTVVGCDASSVQSWLGTSAHRGHTARHLLLLCSQEHTLEVFQMVRRESLEEEAMRRLVVILQDYTPTLAAVLRENTKVLVVRRQDAGRFALLTPTTLPSNKIRLEVVGGWRWSGQRGWMPRLEGPLPYHHLQADLSGSQLKVAAVDNWPWFGLGEAEDGSAVSDSGIDVSILNTLGHVLNFTYSVVVQEDGQWGGPQANGTVTGMLGMVARQEAHLAIDEITITAARARVVDFTRPYYTESSACVSRAPRETNRAFAVLSPFTTQVWITVGLNVIGIGLVLFLLSFLIGQYLEVGVSFSLHDLTFNTYRSLVIQGNRLPTDQWPLRCVLLAWYLYCYYIYAVYAGRLTAVLAIPVFEKPIDTLLDVLHAAGHGLYPVVIRESSVDYMFQMAASGIYHDVGRLITDDNNYVNAPPRGVASVLQGKAAYIDARLSSEIQTIIQGRDNFFIGRQSFFPQSYGIACSKGAPYRAIFDRVLERIVEAGLVDKWKKDEIIKLGQAASLAGRLDQARRGVGPGAITIKHLQGAFFVYVLGSGVASLAFLMEKKVYRSPSSTLLQPGK